MTTLESESNHKQSTIGRSRLGGGTGALLAGSLAIGIAITAALIASFAMVNPDADLAIATFAFAVSCLPIASAGGWALLVDRSTIRGATPRPEDSVESQWLEKSSAAAFRDVLILTGVASAVFAFADIDISAVAVCVSIWILAQLDCAVRYAITRKLAI